LAKNIIKIPLNLDHVKVKKVEHKNDEYHFYVSCTESSAKCHRCGEIISKSHGQCKETIIEHMPIFGERVFIHAKWPRFICQNCDDHPTTSFHPDWLNNTGTFTNTYEDFFLKMMINSTLKDVALKFGTTEEILQGILNRRISVEINWENYDLSKIGIDEIALKKGHSQYLTIITDISNKGNTKVLAVLDGRTKESVVPFLKTIPREKLIALKSVCLDMGASFFSSFKEVINNDRIFNDIVTIDRFHVAKLIGKAFDDERKEIINDLKKQYSNNQVVLEIIKNTMWPLRHHYDDLSLDQKEKLDTLFTLSPYLEKCYDLREELYLIFESNYSKEDARKAIENWSLRALDCKKNDKSPFHSFIKTYNHFSENILNYFQTQSSSGAVEGLNNKIKVIKRRGFGFRNVIQFAQRLFLDINYKFDFLPNI